MIKVAFCDDDISVLRELKDLLEEYGGKNSRKVEYTAFNSPLDLMAEIEKGIHYDILFLDILLPNENGIGIAKEIRQLDNVVKIIFLTSSSEYAVQSYTVGSYYYQMKPIQKETFFALMDSAVLECDKERQRSLILHCKSGLTRIDLDRLEYCEVIGRTLLFHMENGGVLESIGSMDHLNKELSQYGDFVRPHRSFLINMEYIQNISGKTITMESRTEIPIPHGKCSEMKNLYLEYAFEKKRVFLS